MIILNNFELLIRQKMQQIILLLSLKNFVIIIAINSKDSFIRAARFQLDHATYNKMTHQNASVATHDNDEIRLFSTNIFSSF